MQVSRCLLVSDKPFGHLCLGLTCDFRWGTYTCSHFKTAIAGPPTFARQQTIIENPFHSAGFLTNKEKEVLSINAKE